MMTSLEFIREHEGEKTWRCCWNCYHYGHFLGHEGLTCEVTGKPKKRPNNYTNCKEFAFYDAIDGRVIKP